MDHMDQIQQERHRQQTLTVQQEQTAEHAEAVAEELLEDHAQETQQEQLGDEQMNQQFVEMVQQQLERVRVIDAADGAPVQQQAPARRTFKQRRQRAKKERLAKQHCRFATADTYDIHEQFQEQIRCKKRSLTQEKVALAAAEQVDIRVLDIYVRGYRADKHGEPLNEREEQARRADEQFLDDYISKDAQRRKPHLDRILDDYLNVDVSEEKFSEAYLLQHMVERKQACDTMVYFDNVLKDPLNAEYFEALPAHTRALIEAKRNTYAILSTLVTTRLQSIGYMHNAAGYLEANREGNAEVAAMQIPMLEQEAHRVLQEYRAALTQMVH